VTIFGLRQKNNYSSKYLRATDFHICDDCDVKYGEPVNHGDFGHYKYWREEFYWGKAQEK